MQFTGVMPGLSCLKDIQGRVNLREKQTECIEYQLEKLNQQKYVFQLVTGYGKSWVGLISYAVNRAMGRVNRCLIVVPTDTQRQQYINGLEKDADELGIEHRKILEADGKSFVIKSNMMNEADIFVTSIQKIASDETYFNDLMEKGSWMVIADECHKYAKDKTWGNSLTSLDTEIFIGMSATPLRTAGNWGILGEPIVEQTLREARKESAIRGVRIHVEDYFVDIIDAAGDVYRLTTKTIKDFALENHIDDMSEWMLKKEVRISSKYISDALTTIINCILGKRLNHPDTRHQAIVYAMGCKHAKMLSDALDNHSSGLIANWICSDRDENTNRKIIESFESGDIDILVQVCMASEGFNSKYVSILGYMNLWNNESVAGDQSLGRALRRDVIIPHNEDIADIFIPEDNGLAEYFKTLESNVNGEDLIPSKSGDHGFEENDLDPLSLRMMTIPEFHIVNVKFKGEEVFTPLDESEIKTCQEITSKFISDHPESSSDEIFKLVEEAWQKKKNPKLSDVQIRKKASSRVQDAVSIFVRNLLKARFGRSFEKSAQADMYRKVQGKMKQLFGPKDNLTTDELKLSYGWVREQNNTLKFDREVPEWAEL